MNTNLHNLQLQLLKKSINETKAQFSFVATPKRKMSELTLQAKILSISRT